MLSLSRKRPEKMEVAVRELSLLQRDKRRLPQRFENFTPSSQRHTREMME
jgi:hypothetical protein